MSKTTFITLGELLQDVLGLTPTDNFEIVSSNGYMLLTVRRGSKTIVDVWKLDDLTHVWQPYEKPKLSVADRRRLISDLSDFTQLQIAQILGVSQSLVSLDLKWMMDHPGIE